MSNWFEHGAIIGWVIGFATLEAAALGLYYHKTKRGVPFAELWLNQLSGISLMGALWAALDQRPWFWIAGFLAMSLLAHSGDVLRRWRH